MGTRVWHPHTKGNTYDIQADSNPDDDKHVLSQEVRDDSREAPANQDEAGPHHSEHGWKCLDSPNEQDAKWHATHTFEDDWSYECWNEKVFLVYENHEQAEN